MRIITIMSVGMTAGLLAAGTVAAVPAEAQRHGYGGGQRYGDGWHGQRYGGPRQGWRGDRWDRHGSRWRGGNRWQGGHRWDRGARWNRGSRWGNRGYGRVVCRAGYYGRECFRTYR